MPKNSYLDNWAPVICTTCPLRWRSAASDSLAQNPNPQRLRRRFFMPKNKGTSLHKCAFCYFSHSGLACFTKA